jgi:predicted DNA-binding protein
MATNPLPVGTVNFPVNMPEEQRRKLGRLATIEGARSVGAYVREIVAERIAEAEAHGAELARDVRQMLMPWVICLVASLGFASVLVSAAVGQNELRRPAMVRTVRVRMPGRSIRRDSFGCDLFVMEG